MGMAGILFGILFFSLFLGVPIAISLGVAASLTMMITNNAQYLASIPTRMFTQLDSFTLMAVPFFILAGNIMAEGGISDRLISFFELLLKRLPGRLSCICVVASGFFGAISGSNPATVAAIGGICAPKMIEKGYSREDAAAIAASSGTLGVVIPPSIPMVTYAVTASVSVTAMFEAGWIPGIMLIVGLCIGNMFWYKHCDSVDKTKYPVKVYVDRFVKAILALLMPIIILGGIYAGIFTPTECSVVAAMYCVILAICLKRFNLKMLTKALKDTLASAGMSMCLCATGLVFNWVIVTSGLIGFMTNLLMSLGNKIIILLVLNAMLLFLGCFIGSMQILIMVAPLLMNLANALGMTYVQMGVMAVLNVTLGLITPPMAPALFVTAKATGNKFETALKYTVQFLIPMFITLMITAFWEPLTLWLPRFLGSM